MSGAVEICKRYAEMSGKREAAERAAGNEEGAAFESGSTITAMNLADLIARTTPLARSYADEDVARIIDTMMLNADDTAPSEDYRQGVRDTVETYRIAAAIRLLSQDTNEGNRP